MGPGSGLPPKAVRDGDEQRPRPALADAAAIVGELVADRRLSRRDTLLRSDGEAKRAGAAVILQPALRDGRWFGNGTKVASGRIERTTPNVFNMEGVEVAVDLGTPVTEGYPAHRNRFNGKIDKVTIDVGARAGPPDAKTGEAEAAFQE